MSKTNLIVIVIVASVWTACHKDNDYCPGALHNDCSLIDAATIPDQGPTGCSSNTQCTAPTAVCDIPTTTCVQCTSSEASACSGTTPVCGTNDGCRGCEAHAECSSDVCLPDGSCGSDTNVAYVDPGGTDNTSCTKAMPCTKVAKALATGRAFVKFTGSTNDQVSINNQNVTLLADPGAKLSYSLAGVILTVTGTSNVSIYDLSITDGLGSTGVGISMPTGNTAVLSLHRAKLTNNAGGAVSTSGGTLSVTQSTISGNAGGGFVASGGTLTVTQSTISGNAGGGFSLSSTQFTITNNFIAGNGGPSPTNTIGGINLAIVSASPHQLEFNTITANAGGMSVNSGVNCGTVTVSVNLANNIIYGNLVSGSGKQLGGSVSCTASYSDIGPDITAGTGNINADPLFVNAGQSNYHLQAASPAKDSADPAATLNVDFDGDTRPQGPARDMGADEYK